MQFFVRTDMILPKYKYYSTVNIHNFFCIVNQIEINEFPSINYKCVCIPHACDVL